MQPAEQNYEIYDREMLAIIEALKDWRNYPSHLTSSLITLTLNFGAQLKTSPAAKLAGLYTFHGLTST
ncbi:reverse transcriptase-rnase h-integrase [Lentinula edodes]|uniref:Reverse transcriptase-rnase h-integrase n=1 Tax=Lentinula edodes TaxID=5353 RepID=A0A1Q3EII3_LENED|nr:reverse transcriptase-rnase h-integrase [Lentinula edodes]